MNSIPRAFVFSAALALALGLSAIPASADVVISEIMATNSNTNIRDEDGSRPDWLELHNNGAEAVSLNGWYLTDDASNLRKWQLPLNSPVIALPAGGYLRVWCSEKDRKADAGALHTNFKLNEDGEYVGLVRADGLTVAHAYSPTYPRMPMDGSYGIAGTKAWNVLSGPAQNSIWRVRVPQTALEFASTMNGWNTNTAFVDSGWSQKRVTLIDNVPKGIGYSIHNGSSSTDAGRAYLINYTVSPNGVVAAGTDVGASSGMYTTNTSTYPGSTAPTLCARTTFTVADKTTIEQLRLHVRYDDGFIVYLNGVAVLSQNAPTTPGHNTVAPTDRQDDQCEEFDTFVLAGAQAHLVDGVNLLAIHGFKAFRNTPQYVLVPSLEALQAVPGATGGTPAYLATPTPGSENTIASTTLGPSISETTKDPARPTALTDAPFTITTRVQQTLNPIQTVTLRYRRMYTTPASDPTVPMYDDGPAGGHGDAAAGDGIYTGQIPGSFMATLRESMMIRWKVIATDTLGNQSSDPPFRDPLDNEEFFGTVTLTPNIQTEVPLFLWFCNTTATNFGPNQATYATNKAGFRSSVFFQLPGEAVGRFYDNVRFTLHGQSTAGFGKKSQNVNFNADNRFKWREGEVEIGGMNLLSNYADKSHVRNSMMWELWNRTRHPSHFAQMVRVQQITSQGLSAGNSNSGVEVQFLGLMDMVEDGNDEFLERWGLDGEGALYKCYNSLQDVSQTSATNGGGVEKKTREYENFSDLAQLVAQMNTSNHINNRRRWLYDNVDVPGLINFLAVHNLTHSHDFGHKNYYVYRDTNGSGEWKPIPWDQDLSLGHRWTSAQNYFDDDIESASTIFSGGGGNYLMQIVNASGAQELSRMYVRRLRTLMDQYYGPTAAPVDFFNNRIGALLDTIDPPSYPAPTGGAANRDAERDFRKWGFWVDGSGTAITWTDGRAADHRIRPTANRILSSNNTVLTGGPYPGANPYTVYGNTPNLHTSAEPFIPGRRKYLYNENSLNPSIQGNPIPPAQSLTPTISIDTINFNPGTNQDGEYFIIRNSGLFGSPAIDISNWRLSGAVDYEFRPGTVIPGVGTTTSDGASAGWVNQLIVAKDAKAVRQRASSPRANEFRHIQGGYTGQLSARGGTIVLSRPDDPVNLDTTTYTEVASANYAGSPTVGQTNLRITEINYHPTNPTPAELAEYPNLVDDDFEFLEFINNGPSALSLSGARITDAVEFAFPTGYSLASGARCIVTRNRTAFRLRYGTGLDSLIAGEYQGTLSNSSDRIVVLDAVGEIVLDFTYDDGWYPPTDGSGRSLVIRADGTAHDQYALPTSWSIGGTGGGTPGGGDASTANVYEGWRWDHFSQAEVNAGGITGAGIDADGDGAINLHAYAFGGSPRDGSGYNRPVSKLVNVSGIDYPAVEFIRRKNPMDLTIRVEVKGSLDTLGGWTQTTLEVGSPVDLGNGLERVTFRDSEPAGTPRFFQVRAIK